MKKVIIITIISYIVLLTGVGLSVYFFGECNHNLTLVEYHAATCTEDGNVEYWECSLCDKKYTEQAAQNEITETVIPAAGHKLDKTEYKTETCTENGNIEYWECSVCNKKYSDGNAETEITETAIPAGHKLSKTEYKAETCTEDGNIEYWECSVCNKKYSDGNAETEITETAIPAAHKLSKTEYKAETCTENGNIEYWECSVCNKKYSDGNAETEITETAIPAGHKLSKTEYKAETCTEAGNVEYWECSVCNKKYSDGNAEKEITDTVIPISHKYGEYEYDYEKKLYVKTCSVCADIACETAGVEEFPLLARDETELKSVVDAAEQSAYIKLSNDIAVTTGDFAVVLCLPENGTLDLGGFTVTVKQNGGFTVEGTNVALQNGKVVTDFADATSGYALFVGDVGENNIVTVRNIETRGGINVFNCEVALYNCNVDASNHKYYALWADEHSTITVESGEYRGGETACVHSTAKPGDGCGNIVINGGTFHGKIIATYCTTINGGQFDSDIELIFDEVHAKLVVNKEYKHELNIVCAADYEIIASRDTDGNFVYETKLKEENND